MIHVSTPRASIGSEPKECVSVGHAMQEYRTVKSPVHELHSRSLGECTRSVRSVLVLSTMLSVKGFYTLLLPWIQRQR